MKDIPTPQPATSNDVASVAGEPNPPPTTTTQNKPKQRTIWTAEMNEFLVRCYYQITKLETGKNPFSKEMHRLMLEKYPVLDNKTIQNILDQRRSIFSGNRLPADTMRRIKREVSIELGMTPDEEVVLMEDLNAGNMEIELTPAEKTFEKTHTLYDGMDPLSKPRLPKIIFKHKTPGILRDVNNIIAKKINDETSISTLHSLIYTGAYVALTLNEQEVTHTTGKKAAPTVPAWEKRLNTKIDILRKQIGIVTQSLKSTVRAKTRKAAEMIIAREKNFDNPTAETVLDALKQKLSALAKRLKRYKISNARRQQNKQFASSQRAFYKKLRVSSAQGHDPLSNEKHPTPQDTRAFWEATWSNTVNHRQTKWLADEKKNIQNIHTMMDWEVTQEQVTKVINKTLSWKAPGPDNIQNFWYKQFKVTHEHIAKCFTYLLTYPEQTPTFLMSGITYLLPKTEGGSEDPAKYRPITCLPNLYKIFTSVLTAKIYQHLEANKLLDEEQKGCRKGSRGCKEQLVIDAVITSHAKSTKGSLHTAYIDYQKAFDSVPHSWLLEVLDLYRVEKHITKFLQHAMSHWNTKLTMNTLKGTLNTGNINIKRGIFQGDALSPLWFCLALRPLTSMLNRQGKGYTLPQSERPITHLWYMDDLKLYAKTPRHIKDLLSCVGRFSSDIQMKFGLDKCRLNGMVKGVWIQHQGYEVCGDQGTVEGMGEEEQYKYLGYLQDRGIDHQTAKTKISETYLQRVRALLRTHLSGKNTAKAINTYATSAITYSFGVIKWTKTELSEINTKTRKEFRRHRAHHPNSAKERFHLPRKLGGRGIPDVAVRHNKQIVNLRKYFYDKAQSSEIHRAVTMADRRATPLRLADREFNSFEEIVTLDEQMTQWRRKPMHGKYLATIESEPIDTTASTAYLRHGNLFRETEGFVTAIQDQVITTRVYKRSILGEHIEQVKCRLCNERDEYLEHLIAGCSVLAPKSYLDRHNRVGKIIHQNLRKLYMGLTDIVPYYQYEPPPICEDDRVKLYWNRKIITDRTITNNIPDLVLTLKNENKTFIVDFAVPLGSNITKTYSEKLNKYLPLADEIKQMWKMDSVIILPLIVGATGEIPKTLQKNIKQLGLDEKLYIPMQKSVLLDTCAIVRRVLGE